MNLKVLQNPHWDLFDNWDEDFQDFFAFPVQQEKKKNFSPACDFHESESHYFFSLDVPGVKKDNLHIDCADGVLTVSGEKQNEYKEESQKANRYFHEKFHGSFKRSFKLPSPIEEDGIKASFKDGVLELLVPKMEAKKRRKIPISDGKNLFSKIIETGKKNLTG